MIPAELTNWLSDLMTRCGTEIDAVNSTDAEDPRKWVLDVLRHVSQVAETSRRAEVALTAWAIREELTTPTEVARATGVTMPAAASRAGSRRALTELREIFGR